MALTSAHLTAPHGTALNNNIWWWFSSQLFTLVSDLYSTGSLRDMKRWAYEIHSTFVVRDAPLAIKLDDSIIETIENVLKVGGCWPWDLNYLILDTGYCWLASFLLLCWFYLTLYTKQYVHIDMYLIILCMEYWLLWFMCLCKHFYHLPIWLCISCSLLLYHRHITLATCSD